MSVGTIISVIASIPWGEVIDKTTQVTDGAAKLWDRVRTKKPQQPENIDQNTLSGPTQSQNEILLNRLVLTEERALRLEEELTESAEVIKSLAEQNAQLVLKCQQNSSKIANLAIATATCVVSLTGGILYILLR